MHNILVPVLHLFIEADVPGILYKTDRAAGVYITVPESIALPNYA